MHCRNLCILDALKSLAYTMKRLIELQDKINLDPPFFFLTIDSSLIEVSHCECSVFSKPFFATVSYDV